MSEEQFGRIAVVGMAGCFPGARNLSEYWHNLENGLESISHYSDETLRQAGVDEALLTDEHFVKAGAELANATTFDAAFFGFSPAEATLMDPQFRVFLELAWHALEDAGYDANQSSDRIGVFASSSMATYIHRLMDQTGVANPESTLRARIYNDKDFLATLAAYKLNLTGPAFNVQTACSSSLVAVHLAIQSLLSGECDMALAGGVTIAGRQRTGYKYYEGGINSPDGHCRPFDNDAAGTVPGSGAGLVVLKKLEDALEAGDHIEAIILGTALNNDGGTKMSFTAPSIQGQSEVIGEALLVADVSADTIDMVEAHGTGTAVGDPIEIAALSETYRTQTQAKGYCGIGSVKGNIGHLDAAAGIAGLLKCVLALKNRKMPASLHFNSPNERISFPESPFYVLQQGRDWPATDHPRRAAVSSFGVGGTNVHAILEEAPPATPTSAEDDAQLVVLSAKHPQALLQACGQLSSFIEQNPHASLANIAFTLQTGRMAMPYRLAFHVDQLTALKQACDAPTQGVEALASANMVFMFPGQGAQFPGMGAIHYQGYPVYRQSLDACLDILKTFANLDLEPLLMASPEDAQAAAQLGQTRFTQPALFCVSYALAKQWMAWGIQPEAMIGLSIGEYVAACLAGVFSLEDALHLVCLRGRLMNDMPAGAMLAVQADPTWLQQHLAETLDICAINSPRQGVVGGQPEAIEAFVKTLEQHGKVYQRLHTSHAFHSRMMTPMLDSFRQAIGRLTLQPPQLPIISNVTGDWLSHEQAMDPEYWTQHLQQTVQLSAGLSTLLTTADRLFLEVGPGTTMASLLKQQPNPGPSVASLPHPAKAPKTQASLLAALGKVWTYGGSPEWSELHKDQVRARIALPGYAFQGQVFEPVDELSATQTTKLAKSDDMATWFYVPSWQQAPLAPQPVLTEKTLGGHWLVFGNDGPLHQALMPLLPESVSVIRVTHGDAFAQLGDHHIQIQAHRAEDYQQLLSHLPHPPKVILHAWLLQTTSQTSPENDAFYSLLYLAQAIRKMGWQETLKLICLSEQMQAVTGDENIQPHKALALGPIKVIPKEYPQVKCAAIDLHLATYPPVLHKKMVANLLSEIAADLPEPVLALRGPFRWRLDYAPSPLPSQELLIREKGVYLITGGLGGVGLSLASTLAASKPVQLVLTSRTPLPDEKVWQQTFAHFDRSPEAISSRAQRLFLDWHADLDMLEAKETQLKNSLAVADLPQKEALGACLDQFCAGWILQYFKDCQVATDSAQTYNQESLRDRLKILPKFEKFYHFFVRVLREEGLLKGSPEALQFTQAAKTYPSPTSQGAVVKSRFPEVAAVVDLLDHCASHYPQALCGEIEAIGVLYPEGKADLLEKTTRETALFSRDNLYQELLAEWVAHLLATKQNGSLRILEVGGGNGNLTRVLTQRFAECDISYDFTDLGKSFVLKAEKQADADGHAFMNFGVFDITQPPQPQGYQPHHYDLVIGFDVVHATRDIEQSTENMRQLLAPNGLMCLVESVQTHRWVDMVWGLAEGWWHFEDHHLRQHSPLMAPEQWEQALGKHFAAVSCFPRSKEARAKTDFTLVMARQGAVLKDVDFLEKEAQLQEEHWQVNRTRVEKINQLRDLGAKVLPMAVDVTDQAAMTSLVQQITQKYGPICGAIHAAGLLEDRLIQMKTTASAAKVLAPKVTGTQVIAEALKDQPLDFMVLCSSLAAIGGQLTQVDHVAACAFQDAFARSQHPWPVVAINWGIWREVGLAAQLASSQLVGLKQARQAYGMTPAEGGEAFQRVLQTGLPQVVVSTTPLHQTFAQEFLLEVAVPATHDAGSKLHQRPDLKVAYMPPQNPLQAWLAKKWGKLLGIENIGVDDHFFELGADSLLGITLVNELQRDLDEIVHITALLDAPTIAKLADYLTHHYPQAVQRITGVETEEALDGAHPVDREMVAVFEQVILQETPPEPPKADTLDAVAFIISAPRSGSTLLRVMLGGHPDLFAPPEMDLLPFANLAQRRDALIQDPSMLEGATEAVMAAKAITAHQAEQLMRDLENQALSVPEFYAKIQGWIGARLLVEKSPSYALNSATLARANRYFPEAKFVHLVRHPYGMIHSYEQARLDLLFSEHIREKLPFNRRQLAEMTWLISERNIRDFFQTLSPERRFLVRYEDLVREPEQTMRDLCAFLGVSFLPDVLEPYREKHQRMTGGLHANSRMLGDVKFHQHQGITATAADRWRNTYKEDFLGEPTMELATDLDYQPIQVTQKEPALAMEDLVSSLSGDALDDMLKTMMLGEKAKP